MKHFDKYAQSVPTQMQQFCAAVDVWFRHERAGIQYRTGPRFGQQIADAKKAGDL